MSVRRAEKDGANGGRKPRHVVWWLLFSTALLQVRPCGGRKVTRTHTYAPALPKSVEQKHIATNVKSRKAHAACENITQQPTTTKHPGGRPMLLTVRRVRRFRHLWFVVFDPKILRVGRADEGNRSGHVSSDLVA